MESAELIAILREVRDRVRGRNPQTAAGATEIALPDLMPLVQARDAALGKVAAIGTVNPRAGGFANTVVQTWKKIVARVLDWHVREQIEFNRNIVTCVDTAIEALTDTNRALVEMGNRLAAEHEVTEQLKDIRSHWSDWRLDWERKLEINEVQFLRSVADLQGAFQHRVTLMEANFRDIVRAQHAEFHAELERRGNEIQQRLWADLEKIRVEYERLIHTELRMIRQRALTTPASPAPPAPAGAGPGRPIEVPPLRPPEPAFDYGRFAERFRGSEEYVTAGQQFYLEYFKGRQDVLDIGCGRGEFLEMLRDAGVTAGGIDLSEESIALCRFKGLEAERVDLFRYLASLPEGSLDGIFCSQVVEHLPPERLPEMIKLCASRLQRNGIIAIETPNPECLAIFATHFYLDPTHTRPVPAPLLSFYLEEYGVAVLEVRKLSPAVETMPSLGSLPADFRESFFGGLDYAIIGKKL